MEDKYEVVYRAAIKRNGKRSVYDYKTRTTSHAEGDYVVYSRPYSTPGPAKAVVTKARNKKGYHPFIDGWVEVSTGWKVLDED